MKLVKTKTGYRVSGTLPDGRRVRKVLPGVTRAEAQMKWEIWREEAVREMIYGKREEVKTFSDVVELYLRDHPHVMWPVLAKAESQFGSRPVADLTPVMVKTWAMRVWDGKPASINRLGIGPVRAAVNYAAEHGWCQPLKVRGVKVPKPVRRVSTRDWRQAFYKTAMDMGPSFLGVGTMVELMARTGLRTAEACALTWADVDWGRGTVKVRDTKNGESYVVEVSEDVMTSLKAVRVEAMELLVDQDVGEATKERWRHNLVFGMPDKRLAWRKVEEVCEVAGIEKLTPHEAGRHTFATRLSEEFGWTPNQIAKAGRWKDVGVVMDTYLHTTKGTKRASELLGE